MCSASRFEEASRVMIINGEAIMNRTEPYKGVWPVAPTPFNDDGSLDLDGMRRVLDCMVDQGVDGLSILANYAEQFLLSDDERETLTTLCLDHLAGRVPVIVTCSHFATAIVVQRVRRAKDLGAAMVMLMPPYHGALLKGSEEQTYDQFARASEIGLPIMVQDAPLAGVTLSVPFLARLAKALANVSYFKIEMPQTADKLRALIAAGGAAIEGPFDGEEAITLMADLDAGATGTMPSALLPDLIKPVVEAHGAGDRAKAAKHYASIVPLINFENRQCGLRACKTVMMEGGVIRSDHVRHPLAPLPQGVARWLARARKRSQARCSQLGKIGLASIASCPISSGWADTFRRRRRSGNGKPRRDICGILRGRNHRAPCACRSARFDNHCLRPC